jgi:iron(III) transport system substrate-binding protein
MNRSRPSCRPGVAALLGAVLAACSEPDVVLYVALDQQYSEQIVRDFEKATGLDVEARFDTEASKTVGLVSAIVEEAERPRCDVFWNNELAHTVNLAQRGLLAQYDSPAAQDLPERWRDPGRRWNGFAARARVLIVNTQKIPDAAARPTSMWDLIDPRWKGQCGVARPLTGTTLTHFAALEGVLGEKEFQRFMTGLHENQVVWLQSNGATMRAVRDGQLAFAFTDTDDFHVALTKGHPVACVFPDQQEGGVGTMLIPNSAGIVAQAPHRTAAEKLVDFILAKDMEARLAAAPSAQIPLRAGVPGPKEPQILTVDKFKAMAWDPVRTAGNLADFSKRMQARFAQ